ncbi:MAG: asparaginase [Proteobacteria bacterium]|nr:asparaginase [Pseudomonadota bacterium]
MATNNGLIVEVTRGDMVESRHVGACVVVDADGGVVHAWGDTDRVIYPRSAIKPLQALALIETGAADAYSLSDAELALAAASHGGTAEHIDGIGAWLKKIGLGPDDLECGSQDPSDKDAARALIKSGAPCGRIHNNCSGKHTGFLTAALHKGEPTRGYLKPDHPVQRRLLAILTEMGGADLSRAPRGTDGCGIPVIGMPLKAMALGLARMADPKDLSPSRAEAANRIFQAMTTHPRLVDGPGCFDTLAMQAAKGAAVIKKGAEGMFGAIVPGLGLGIALKIDDGAKRASETAMAAVLTLLGVLDLKTETPVLNATGEPVGVVRMSGDWPGR